VSRIRPLTRAELNEKQLSIWDELVASRGPGAITPDGCVQGPLDIWLHAPALGLTASSLGGIIRSEASLDRKLQEIVILTAVAHWKGEYNWWAHAVFAHQLGVTEDVLEAIASGVDPDLDSEKERSAYVAARRLLTTGHLDDELFGTCVQLFGEVGTVELSIICGYYSLVSFALNVATVRLPEGVSPRWAENDSS
jgi:4-carboxymuconolactone decarboxylase